MQNCSQLFRWAAQNVCTHIFFPIKILLQRRVSPTNSNIWGLKCTSGGNNMYKFQNPCSYYLEMRVFKLDGVTPLITDDPPTSSIIKKYNKHKKKLNKLGDMWHVTHDMWHVTCDTQSVVNIVSKFQIPSSNGLGFMMSWRLGGKWSLSEWMNEWMNELMS